MNKIKEIKSNKPKRKKNIANIIMGIIFVINLILGIGYLIYNVKFMDDKVNQLYLIINSAIVVILIILFTITMFMDSIKTRKIMSIFTSLLFIFFIGFNFLINTNSLKLPTKEILDDFTNKNVSEVIEWANGNNIQVEQIYEYSDNVPEYHIISQNISSDTLLKDVKKIVFVVSSGPNYDKEVIISNMVGWTIDDTLESINNNFLNNVTVEYIYSDDVEKDIVIEQSTKGQMRRNEALSLKVSLGSENSIEPVEMINLKNGKLFDATLWLKRNGISYELEYKFSNDIKRNYVISQSDKEGTIINQDENTVTLIVSKGKEITVPDLKSMNIDEVTNWIIKNNLKIKYEDKYDADIEFGKIISANYKKGDIIEEGTNIEVITSKGSLRMPKFNSISEFRDWASKYNIETEEKYEYNNSIKKGSIIKFSHKENEVISQLDKVIVYISNGAPVTIPNFIGKSKTNILNTCYNVGLNCTFYYSGYSSSSKDVAVDQNKKVGSSVVIGTYVNIGLSLGSAKTFTVQISEAQLSVGSADGTINTLKNWFSSNYKDVTFTFVKKPSNEFTTPGYIHESSPIKDGSSIKQGQSYQVWITN